MGGRAGLFGLMERTRTLRGGLHGKWPRVSLGGRGGATASPEPGLLKPDFRLGKHLGVGRGVWGLGGRAESLDPGQGGELQDGREQKGGPNSPAWSQAAIWPPSHEGYIMARLASAEGARREGAQASGLTSEVHA